MPLKTVFTTVLIIQILKYNARNNMITKERNGIKCNFIVDFLKNTKILILILRKNKNIIS
jgi:hypothetical protein